MNNGWWLCYVPEEVCKCGSIEAYRNVLITASDALRNFCWKKEVLQRPMFAMLETPFCFLRPFSYIASYGALGQISFPGNSLSIHNHYMLKLQTVTPIS